MFKRKIHEALSEWKRRSQGRTALLVEGARRVGKSTVVKEFAEHEYQSHIIVDFSTAPPEVFGLFDDVSDLDYLFLRLQLQYSARLHERQSLIVFDEVQLCPKARQAIKSLVADGRYDYVETGSLISIRKNTRGILIPSEEERVQMHPMDYEEFLWAKGDVATVPLLREAFATGMALGDGTNRKLMRDFRLYMLVGGMPQAVDALLRTNNLQEVDKVKRAIISLYEEDFHKISPSGALSMLFDAIPSQLAKKASRYQVSSVLAGRQARDILEEIAELADSKTVLVARQADDPNVGLSSSVDLEKFKLYMADTGLFVTLAFKDAEFQTTSCMTNSCPTNCLRTSACCTRTPSHRNSWHTGKISSTTHGRRRGQPVTTRSTSSFRTARKSVPSKSNHPDIKPTHHWTRSPVSSIPESADNISSIPRTFARTVPSPVSPHTCVDCCEPPHPRAWDRLKEETIVTL